MPTVQTNDAVTYYERRGEGPPVVFVHGAILDGRSWAPQVEALAGEFTTVTYDVRGHGRTGATPARTYSIDLMADDLRALVEALDLDRPVVCGLSMGGCVAGAYAAAHPDEVGGLVLADTFGPEIYSRREWLQRSLGLRATIPPVRLLGYERVERAMVWLQERFTRGVAGEYERIERLREAGPSMSTEEFAKVIRAVASFHETTVDYGAVDVPALVLYGERDVPWIREHAAALAAALPHASVLEVPEAGHASNLDNPAFFTDAVRSFLRRVVEE